MLNMPEIIRNRPYAEFVHQPSSKYRMRYANEGRNTYLFSENVENRSFSSDLNRDNDQQNLNLDGVFPRIKIYNLNGLSATLVVSCVSSSKPYHIHPNQLIGNVTNGTSGRAFFKITQQEVEQGRDYFDLAGVSIITVKKEDVEARMVELRQNDIDPFSVGFNFEYDEINLRELRLCFQVFLHDPASPDEIIRDEYHCLEPIVSNIIHNCYKKDLELKKCSDSFSPASGGRNIIILFTKLETNQNSIKAKFYDKKGWEENVAVSNLHYKCAAALTVPAYANINITENVQVFLKIVASKDMQGSANGRNDQNNNLISESNDLKFFYTPN